jgi:hypothetical protein
MRSTTRLHIPVPALPQSKLKRVELSWLPREFDMRNTDNSVILINSWQLDTKTSGAASLCDLDDAIRTTACTQCGVRNERSSLIGGKQVATTDLD